MNQTQATAREAIGAHPNVEFAVRANPDASILSSRESYSSIAQNWAEIE